MSQIQWMWEKDDSSGYLDCDEDLNNLLEFFFTRRNVTYDGFRCDANLDPPVVGFTIPTSYNKDMRWTFNFDTMTQTSYSVIDGKTRSTRRIIRTDSGKVWIWYELPNTSNFYGFNNISILSRLNRRQVRGAQAGLNPKIVRFTYTSISPPKTINCSNLEQYATQHTCDNSVIIELVDVNRLRPPVQGIAAQVTQQYPHTTTAAGTTAFPPPKIDGIL